MLEKIAIRFISWNLRRKNIDNIELVIRSDGYTWCKRDKDREESIKNTLKIIK